MFTADDITPKLRKELDPLERALKHYRQMRLVIPRMEKKYGVEYANQRMTGDPKSDARGHLDKKLSLIHI